MQNLSRVTILVFIFLILPLNSALTQDPPSELKPERPLQKTEKADFIEEPVSISAFSKFRNEEIKRVDINSAPLEDLVKIIHIGEKMAQELISLRPFYSLDELTKIKGIGEKKLEDIKKQGLAWVDPELEPPKIEETKPSDKKLAAAAEPFKQRGLTEKTPKSLSLFLIALPLAIFSAIIILILKRKLKTEN